MLEALQVVVLNEDLPEPGNEKTKKARRRNRFRRRAWVDTRGSMPQALSVPLRYSLAVQPGRPQRLSRWSRLDVRGLDRQSKRLPTHVRRPRPICAVPMRCPVNRP